jgi:putative N6-adenine-specific DNA methylase
MNITLIATTAMGLESVLKQELLDLGYSNLRVFDGKVEYEGELSDICRSNLWLRTAGRIYIKIAQFKAVTFDDLFDQTSDLPWSDWIQADDAFPVTKCISKNSILYSRSDIQALVKKAVVEHLKRAHKVRELPETGSTFPIRVQVDKDIVTLSIDATGDGLNKRGYRAHMDIAPLRETLAAGMVLLSRYRADKDVLMDPMCGTGTILIEAAMIAQNMAPGLKRHFNSMGWDICKDEDWRLAKEEAEDLIVRGADFRILGSDTNWKALEVARKNAELAGVENVHFQKLSIKELGSRFKTGKLITNPPYGERLSEREEVETLYQDLGWICQTKMPEWSHYVITPHEHFEKLFGKKADKKRKLYNGGIKCHYYQFF